MAQKFFWLHIKKSGGQSFRKTFSPYYVETDRTQNYKPFIALPKEEWNDALNNYRIPLGEYDYRRMLFAQKFLYSEEEFNSMFKFVIVRNPYSRAVSCWKYLTGVGGPLGKLAKPKKILMKYSFQRFLEELPNLWETKWDRHFATHTAPMWGDITGEQGELLVDKIYRLENVGEAIQDINQRLGLNIDSYKHINKYTSGKPYHKYYNKTTRRLVEEYYKDDVEQLGYKFGE